MVARPRWRRSIDGLEHVVSPRVETILGSEEFAIALGLTKRVQKAVTNQVARSSSRLMHRLNLPAATDVTRLLQEIGRLNREVAELKDAVSGIATVAAGGATGQRLPRTNAERMRRAGSGGDEPVVR